MDSREQLIQDFKQYFLELRSVLPDCTKKSKVLPSLPKKELPKKEILLPPLKKQKSSWNLNKQQSSITSPDLKLLQATYQLKTPLDPYPEVLFVEYAQHPFLPFMKKVALATAKICPTSIVEIETQKQLLPFQKKRVLIGRLEIFNLKSPHCFTTQKECTFLGLYDHYGSVEAKQELWKLLKKLPTYILQISP